MEAAINVKRNKYTKHSGIAMEINVGIILSILPATIFTAIFPKLSKKNTLERDPTIYAVVGIKAMNTPPIKIERFNSLSDFTVMNLTASDGCASAPIPTPKIVVVTRFHQ